MKQLHKALIILVGIFMLTLIGNPIVHRDTSLQFPLNSVLRQTGIANPSAEQVEVIVQKEPHYGSQVLLQQVGGILVAELPLINGFVAKVPVAKLGEFSHLTGVRQVSLNQPVASAAKQDFADVNKLLPKKKIGKDTEFKPAKKLHNIFRQMVQADGLKEKGKGVTIAVLDSGIGKDSFSTSEINLLDSVAIDPEATTVNDLYGHGTHVAGIINAKGPKELTGIAPEAGLINVKLGDDSGEVTEADLLLGLEWVHDFKDAYGIKVVNLSVSSSVSQDYLDSPIDAAVEELWLSGVTVVAAAGNDKVDTSDVNFAPANDPFVITVGSVDGNGKDKAQEAVLSTWSKRGITPQGIAKPDVTAPGVDIISLLPEQDAELATEHPEAMIDGKYLQMSGTSMATPVVSGAVALMLEANPSLTPDQIKQILISTSIPYENMVASAGVINAKKAVEAARDLHRLDSIITPGYNVWPLAEWVGDQQLSFEFTKASWRDLAWTKASWRYLVWTKASWRNTWDE